MSWSVPAMLAENDPVWTPRSLCSQRSRTLQRETETETEGDRERDRHRESVRDRDREPSQGQVRGRSIT